MEIFRRETKIDFIGKRWLPMTFSMLLNVATLVSLFVFGLNFGLDFTGGTVVEVSYKKPVEVADVRAALSARNMHDAVVQHFGTTQDVMVRLPLIEGEDSAKASTRVVEALRAAYGENEIESLPGQAQKCIAAAGAAPEACGIQVRRVEFVGPQVGRELAEKGGLALIFSAIGILIYVIIRFEWRFAIGAIAATAHDVFLLFGFFSISQLEFSLSVLAAILAILGYSLNDTVVVFDRIRENFRKMRRNTVTEIMNASVNQTLSRTIITSMSTLLTMGALLAFGGETLYGFSLAMIIGIFIGTYSSIFIATPVTLLLGITREDMQVAKKETSGATDTV